MQRSWRLRPMSEEKRGETSHAHSSYKTRIKKCLQKVLRTSCIWSISKTRKGPNASDKQKRSNYLHFTSCNRVLPVEQTAPCQSCSNTEQTHLLWQIRDASSIILFQEKIGHKLWEFEDCLAKIGCCSPTNQSNHPYTTSIRSIAFSKDETTSSFCAKRSFSVTVLVANERSKCTGIPYIEDDMGFTTLVRSHIVE